MIIPVHVHVNIFESTCSSLVLMQILPAAPEFTIFPEDISVPENGSVVLTCEANADPRPKIWWTVNGLDPAFYLDGIRKMIIGNVCLI